MTDSSNDWTPYGHNERRVDVWYVDEVTFARLTDAIENPRPPNQALIDLFRAPHVGRMR